MKSPIPDFQNTEIAFKHLSDGELYRAWTLFKVINVKPLVVAGPPLVSAALKVGLPVQGLLRATVFNHFCGGETLDDCASIMKRLHEGGVFSILDYGVEGEKTEQGFDAARAEVLRTILATSGHASVPFCVFKLTALARFDSWNMSPNTDRTNSLRHCKSSGSVSWTASRISVTPPQSIKSS